MGFRNGSLPVFRSLRYTSFMTDKKPLTDEERQAYLDNLLPDRVNPNAKETFDLAIEHAAKPKQSEPETPEPADDYSDKQTHSDTTEDTSDSHSDTFHQ